MPSRKITNKINSFLDNIMPPVLRDNKVIMSIPFRLAIGKKYKYYFEFKDKLNELSEEDINNYYSILADTFMKRETDCNDKCIKYILDNVGGCKDNVLDAATGRGYLANKLLSAGCNNITAVDIVLPEKQYDDIKYVQSSLTQLPFEDNTFKYVVCTHALEHIRDVHIALSELRRVCYDKLIIVIPKQREYKYTFDLHINFYPYKYSVEKLFKNKKIDIINLDNDWLCVEKKE